MISRKKVTHRRRRSSALKNGSFQSQHAVRRRILRQAKSRQRKRAFYGGSREKLQRIHRDLFELSIFKEFQTYHKHETNDQAVELYKKYIDNNGFNDKYTENDVQLLETSRNALWATVKQLYGIVPIEEEVDDVEHWREKMYASIMHIPYEEVGQSLRENSGLKYKRFFSTYFMPLYLTQQGYGQYGKPLYTGDVALTDIEEILSLMVISNQDYAKLQSEISSSRRQLENMKGMILKRDSTTKANSDFLEAMKMKTKALMTTMDETNESLKSANESQLQSTKEQLMIADRERKSMVEEKDKLSSSLRDCEESKERLKEEVEQLSTQNKKLMRRLQFFAVKARSDIYQQLLPIFHIIQFIQADVNLMENVFSFTNYKRIELYSNVIEQLTSLMHSKEYMFKLLNNIRENMLHMLKKIGQQIANRKAQYEAFYSDEVPIQAEFQVMESSLEQLMRCHEEMKKNSDPNMVTLWKYYLQSLFATFATAVENSEDLQNTTFENSLQNSMTKCVSMLHELSKDQQLYHSWNNIVAKLENKVEEKRDTWMEAFDRVLTLLKLHENYDFGIHHFQKFQEIHQYLQDTSRGIDQKPQPVKTIISITALISELKGELANHFHESLKDPLTQLQTHLDAWKDAFITQNNPLIRITQLMTARRHNQATNRLQIMTDSFNATQLIEYVDRLSHLLLSVKESMTPESKDLNLKLVTRNHTVFSLLVECKKIQWTEEEAVTMTNKVLDGLNNLDDITWEQWEKEMIQLCNELQQPQLVNRMRISRAEENRMIETEKKEKEEPTFQLALSEEAQTIQQETGVEQNMQWLQLSNVRLQKKLNDLHKKDEAIAQEFVQCVFKLKEIVTKNKRFLPNDSISYIDEQGVQRTTNLSNLQTTDNGTLMRFMQKCLEDRSLLAKFMNIIMYTSVQRDDEQEESVLDRRVYKRSKPRITEDQTKK